MKKHKLLIFLLLSFAALRGQTIVTTYVPTLVSGAGILEVTETRTVSGGTGHVNKTLVYSADTAAMRKYMTAEMAFQEAEADRYAALQAEARAKADSIYAALEVLNEGLSGVDDTPRRTPSTPNDAPDVRWGAILRNDENEIG